MRRLGVVGLVSLDRIDGGLPRLGGAVTYAARAVRALERPVVLATKLADEDRPRLRALGVPVAAGPARKTIVFEHDYDGETRRSRLDELGEPFTPKDTESWLGAALAGVGWVHAGALTRGDFPVETLAALRRGRVLSLDGQALVRPAALGDLVLDHSYDPQVLRHLDVLKLAREELEALGLELDERSLASLGVREVLVTLGRDGAVVYADGLAEHVPTVPLEGVDPTGAGDSWMVAYAVFRGRRHSPVSAARLANGVTNAMLGTPRRWRAR
jgi:sugar/nucleoside kinase (ribokinase family)